MTSSARRQLLAGLTPEMILDDSFGTSKDIPFEPMEFFESDRYCGMHLYPNQRLLLKLINLYEDYTDRENQIIDEWTRSYATRGYRVGVVSDVRERIRILRRDGYKAFNQIILILGRRASKTTLCGAQWALHDAQLLSEGIPRVSDTSKQDDVTYGIAMATTAKQAQESIFASYYRTVSNCPWFSRYIKRVTPFEITYQTLEDKLKTVDMIESGINVEREPVSMVCRPISSNSDSIRGRPVVDYVFDETFFSLAGNSSRSGDRSISAILPATQTFGKDRLVMFPSSPWTRAGRVYRIYLQGDRSVAGEVDGGEMDSLGRAADDLGDAVAADPSIFVAQLESWRLYEDWDEDSYVPTYHSGWSPKKLTLVDEDGNTVEVEAETNAETGDYVELDGDEDEDEDEDETV